MRQELSDFLVKTAQTRPDFMVLSGDHGYALFDGLRSVAPEKFINAGVSEQAMIGYAAGLAKSGFKVLVYGLGAFVPLRVFEFIKMDVCYDNLPVIFLGDGAGLVYNTLGASHQCAEDISMMRALPNMDIFSPADKYELRACMEMALANPRPSYVRIGKSDKPEVHKEHFQLVKNPAIPLTNKESKLTLFATGSMVSTALSLSETFNCNVVSVPFITGLTPAVFRQMIGRSSSIVTLEEHAINGGLGSLIAELVLEGGHKIDKFFRIGLGRAFTEKCGSYEYALREHGIDENSIAEKMRASGLC